MGEDWLQEQQDIYDGLMEDGVLFSISRQSEQAKPDPITGDIPVIDDTTFYAPGMLKMATSNDINKWTNWIGGEGSLVQQDSQILITAAKTYEQPALDDRVLIDGRVYVIRGFAQLKPATVPLLNYLVVREI